MPLQQSQFFLFSPLFIQTPRFFKSKGFYHSWRHHSYKLSEKTGNSKVSITIIALVLVIWWHAAPPCWSHEEVALQVHAPRLSNISQGWAPTSVAGSWWVSAQFHASPEPGSPCTISGRWPDHLFFLLSSPWALVVLFGQLFILGLALQEANFLQAFSTAVNLCGH